MKDQTLKRDSIGDYMSRVDGRLKVTGAAKYAAEYQLPNMSYAVLVTSTITKGTIAGVDSKKAEGAPGVLAVVSYLNAPKIPGYAIADDPAKKTTTGKPYRIFSDENIYFNGQPVAMVIADTFERATYAATLVKVSYNKADDYRTNLLKSTDKAVSPGGRNADYVRGEADAYKNAPVKIEQEYILPSEMHNPMELHSLIANWDGDDKVTLYDKTQGVKGTQRSIMDAFKLQEQNVQINSRFVGGAFGSALRTWPHVIACVLGAKIVKRPVKLSLTREQQFTMVGYRPYTVQKMGLGATVDGKLVGITHESNSQTSVFEQFTEGSVAMSKFMYATPNVNTRYKITPLNISTPAPMRGPGEATGAYALECAMDELAYALNLDPIELRLRNYAETDLERNLPYSSKFLKECYQIGTEKIGWKNRSQTPGTVKDGEWLVGYGMGSGVFGAHRGRAMATLILKADGTVNIKSATSDIGPGTATSMVLIAADTLNIPAGMINFELGDSSYPQAPSQGGSATVASVGSAVHDACLELRKKMIELSGKPENEAGQIAYSEILKTHNLPQMEVSLASNTNPEAGKYSSYSFSAHFCQVYVNPLTGQVRVKKAVAVVDAGTIINQKTAQSQMKGGVVGGIGMALTEEAKIDDRFGRYINHNLADYHVPVHADVPQVEAVFINKPDPIVNPMGTKGIGEISIIGFAPALANAVYNATGKRVREMPITPDKLI
jgi:xanthine dehydrogenase YagR molybdenum-binding subunit